MTSRSREAVQEARNVRLCTTTTSDADVQEVARPAPTAATAALHAARTGPAAAPAAAPDAAAPLEDPSVHFSGTKKCKFKAFDTIMNVQPTYVEGLAACARPGMPPEAYSMRLDPCPIGTTNKDATRYPEEQSCTIRGFKGESLKLPTHLCGLMNVLGASRAAHLEATDAYNERVRWYIATVIAKTMNLYRIQQLMVQAASYTNKRDGMIFVFDTNDVTQCLDTDVSKCHPTHADLLRLYALSGNQIELVYCGARDPGPRQGTDKDPMELLDDALRTSDMSITDWRQVVVVLSWMKLQRHEAYDNNPYMNYAIVKGQLLDNSDFRTFCNILPKSKPLEHFRVAKPF